jgi:GNAT superfamily N-acetyltransferase
MSLRFAQYRGAELAQVTPDLAALRIAVFRDWPYLYEGDLDYERSYLARYASGQSILIAAYDGDRMVGASTGMPLEDHGDASQIDGLDVPATDIFYCAESVLLPAYRGQGAGHRFFDGREAHARTLDRTHSAFCAIVRPQDHPAHPLDYAPLSPFWHARGYAPVQGAQAQFSWTDVGDPYESPKTLQLWMKRL